MNDDIELAITVLLHDNDIFDEDLIKRFIDLYIEIGLPDIDELLNESFELDNNEEINYTHNSQRYISNINELRNFNDHETTEIINNNAQNMLRLQYLSTNNLNNSNNNITNGFQPTIQLNNIFQYMGIGSQMGMLPLNNFLQLGFPFMNNDSPVEIEGIFQMLNEVLGEKVSVTLTKDALNNLIELTYDELIDIKKNIDLEEACSICFSKLSEDTNNFKYIILPCNHIFHSECIKTYLSEYDHHCPICKQGCGESSPKLD